MFRFYLEMIKFVMWATVWNDFTQIFKQQYKNFFPFSTFFIKVVRNLFLLYRFHCISLSIFSSRKLQQLLVTALVQLFESVYYKLQLTFWLFAWMKSDSFVRMLINRMSDFFLVDFRMERNVASYDFQFQGMNRGYVLMCAFVFEDGFDNKALASWSCRKRDFLELLGLPFF